MPALGQGRGWGTAYGVVVTRARLLAGSVTLPSHSVQFPRINYLEFNSRKSGRRYQQDSYQKFTSTGFLHQHTGTCLSKVRGTRHYCFSGLIGAVMSSLSKPHVHFRYLNHAYDKRDDLALLGTAICIFDVG